MIYITGDTHARFDRFSFLRFPQQRRMTREDYVIICGDFGGLWDLSPQRLRDLDELNSRPFTTLFITGNHDNYDLLEQLPVTLWHGGKVQFIRENVIHLMRGQVYELEGKTFFTMGGAACHDIQNGVLDTEEPGWEDRALALRAERKFFRIRHLSWWEQELPTGEELEEGRQNLLAHDNRVDCILTHCAPTEVQRQIMERTGNNTYPVNTLTDYLQEVYENCSFSRWYCGHYHSRMDLEEKLHVRYESIERLY